MSKFIRIANGVMFSVTLFAIIYRALGGDIHEYVSHTFWTIWLVVNFSLSLTHLMYETRNPKSSL